MEQKLTKLETLERLAAVHASLTNDRIRLQSSGHASYGADAGVTALGQARGKLVGEPAAVTPDEIPF